MRKAAFRTGRVLAEPVLQEEDFRTYRRLSTLTALSALGFVVVWIAADWWEGAPLVMALLSLAISILFAGHQGSWLMLPAMKRPRLMPARPDWKVGVVTTYVPGAESLAMLERTVRALVQMDYPHETWVLDEGDLPEVRALCARTGARQYSRATVPAYRTESGVFQYPSKHGNYNAWLHEIGFERYDIISAFDPDHVPDPSFLEKVLGYFDDPRVGYVQAPQAYSNQAQSLVARGAAEETYGFYSIFQMAFFGRGHALVIGCHNTHRVSALKEAGGFAAHDADDLLLTNHYRRLGWAGVYVPEILARGLTPADWAGYLRQQRRWARAIFDLKWRVMPGLLPSLPRSSRAMGIFQGMSFLLTSGAMFVLLLGGTALIAVEGVAPPGSSAVLASGGMVLLSVALCRRFTQRFYLDPERERGWHWRAIILQLVKGPWVWLAVLDVLLARRIPYLTTPKLAEPLPLETRAA